MKYYILKDKEPISASLFDWAAWSAREDRTVLKTILDDGKRVSTVFLGINHGWIGGPPLLFETMVFRSNSNSELYCARYTTWAEAEEGHWRAVAKFDRQDGPE